jgi:glycosyltransferase involved in cell wall biosynthesis
MDRKALMNLGYLVPEFPSQTHAFFWRELSAIRAMGDEVHILSTRRPPYEACPHDFADSARRQTHYVFPPEWQSVLSTVIRRPGGMAAACGYLARLDESTLLEKARTMALVACAADLWNFSRHHRLDHIHVHSCADAAHLAALCRTLGGPTYSLTLHGDLPVYGKDHTSKMRSAAFVSAVTRPLQDQIVQQVGLPLDRVPVIPMGVDTDRFQDRGLRSHLPHRLHMVTVARLNPTKGHEIALEAMRLALNQGYDLHYTIAGEGPHRHAIEEQIRRLDLAHRVAMPGILSEEAVLRLLQEADAFVLPSFGLGEAAPVSVMEAMACGLPVICSLIGGTPDMITSGVEGILVEQKDVAGLESAMLMLASRPDRRAGMGRAARRRAVSTFDYRNHAKALRDRIRLNR